MYMYVCRSNLYLHVGSGKAIFHTFKVQKLLQFLQEGHIPLPYPPLSIVSYIQLYTIPFSKSLHLPKAPVQYAWRAVYHIYSNRSRTPNSSHPWIVAACMCDVDYMGVVTIASGPRLLIQCKTMAEDSLGLVLMQHRSFFDDCISITQSEVFINQSSVLQFLWRTLCGMVRN